MKKFLDLLERRFDPREVLCVFDTHILIRLSTILYSFLNSRFLNLSNN